MKLVKPEPLIIGGHAHYTLSSYDPVTVELRIPRVTETDIDLAIAAMTQEAGGTPEEAKNDAWVRENFEGATGASDLRDFVANQIVAMSTEIAEEEKATQCASALAQRLEQSVPQASIEQYRQMIRQTFYAQLAQDNMTIENVAAAAGVRPSDFDVMFDEQAVAAAENEAALDAWAEHRKLTVSDEEIPRFLRLDPVEADDFLRDASAHGALETVRQAALRSKALEIVTAECSCTYIHETPQEAAQRSREMLEQAAYLRDNAYFDEPAPESSSHPNLTLV